MDVFPAMQSQKWNFVFVVVFFVLFFCSVKHKIYTYNDYDEKKQKMRIIHDYAPHV